MADHKDFLSTVKKTWDIPMKSQCMEEVEGGKNWFKTTESDGIQ